MSQMSFSDFEYAGKRKQTRCSISRMRWSKAAGIGSIDDGTSGIKPVVEMAAARLAFVMSTGSRRNRLGKSL
ncbi:hypothetical protein QQ994_03400 [Pseudomonas asiatica]|nr:MULTISPECIES: hypothetical protein [Pseudomonas]WJD70934.1 hypothetical protein QQ994_03400 [Pseudomonas asiatica]